VREAWSVIVGEQNNCEFGYMIWIKKTDQIGKADYLRLRLFIYLK